MQLFRYSERVRRRRRTTTAVARARGPLILRFLARGDYHFPADVPRNYYRYYLDAIIVRKLKRPTRVLIISRTPAPSRIINDARRVKSLVPTIVRDNNPSSGGVTPCRPSSTRSGKFRRTYRVDWFLVFFFNFRRATDTDRTP